MAARAVTASWPGVVAAALLGGTACGEVRDIELVPIRGPAPGACGLGEPAFCDAFDAATPGGRAGDLDERLWSVARITQATNPTQGSLNSWRVSTMKACEGPRKVVPGQDFVVCAKADGNPRLRHSFHDGGNFALHAIRARRPFDFAGRTGRIVFDVDAWFTRGHGTWLEVWITDQPVPGPHRGGPGVATTPRNAIALDLNKDCGGNAVSAGVRTVTVYRNHQAAELGGRAWAESRCFKTAREALNHVEIRIGASDIEVWASDAGAPETFRRVARMTRLALPLGRGFVHFHTVHMNAAKDGNPPDETHVWDNLGFDGPLLALPVGHDVPDNLRWVTRADTAPETIMNTGWAVPTGAPVVVRVDEVRRDGAIGASLDLDVSSFEMGMALRYRLNDAEPRDAVHALPISTASWRALSLPVRPEDLRDGINTIEILGIGTNQFTNMANIGLTLDVR